MVGIIYGSTMGETKEMAQFIADNLNLECEVLDVASTDAQKINSFDSLILGSSTWNDGELQDDWDSFDFSSLDLDGKKVAIFGLGDSSGYGDTFCNAMAEIYDRVTQKGANVIGFVDSSGYDFAESRALQGSNFVGLALDNCNESDKSEGRILEWLDKIRPEL